MLVVAGVSSGVVDVLPVTTVVIFVDVVTTEGEEGVVVIFVRVVRVGGTGNTTVALVPVELTVDSGGRKDNGSAVVVGRVDEDPGPVVAAG